MTNEELYYLPASELLKHIQAEKERLIKEKIIKKPKELPPITDEEKPYDLPEGWEWVRLGDIVSITSGLSYKKPQLTVESNDMVRVLRGGNISDMNYCYKKDDIFISREFVNEQLLLKKYDIITPAVTSYEHVGKSSLILEDLSDVVVGGFVLFIRGYLDNAILLKNVFYFINTTEFKDICKSITNKSGQAFYNLSREKLAMQLIPLPPLYIQDQIVQKLEQLSETKNSLLSHAESQLNYTKKMREALLQEAIRGELVPQDENDEPASVLLEKIKTEKERLIKEKVIKKSKALPQITDEEKPYDLPEGWEWVRLGEIIEVNSRKGKNSNDISNETWVLEMEDIEKNTSKLLQKIYNSDRQVSSNKYSFKKNDVLYGKLRPYLNKVLIASDEGVCSSEILPLQPYQIESKYIKTYLMSPDFLNYANNLTSGTRMPRLGTDDLRKAIFPLPPLAEQKRIVAKLDELMANCNQLEVKAEEMKNYTSKLFEASLKEAFKPE
ncbi:Type I restriction enzyme EcoKI specificity protein [Turicibacter sanguinis]|nr:Type I restriction enzyme EcoKI specificity protein [Turicibacter sanguinis]